MNIITRRSYRWLVAILLSGSLFGSSAALSAEQLDEAASWEDYEQCGQVAFYVIARIQGKHIDWKTACDLMGPGDDGLHSFADLESAAKRAGLTCVAIESTASNLESLPAPAVLQTSSYVGSTRPHFSIFLGIKGNDVCLLDAPHRPMRYPLQSLQQIWTGKALTFFRTDDEATSYASQVYASHRAEITSRIVLIASCLFVFASAVILLRRFRVWHTACKLLQCSKCVIGRWRFALGFGCVGVCMIAAITFWLVRGSLANVRSGPKLALPSFLDFGEIGSDEETKFLTARNIGDAPLRISTIQTSCGCVAPDVPDVIPPGRDAQIRLKVTAISGPKRVDLVFHSNDPSSPGVVRIRTMSAVRPTLCPGRLYFEVQEKIACEESIRVCYPASQAASPLRIASVDGPPGLAVFDLAPVQTVTRRSGYTTPLYRVLGESKLRVRLLPQQTVKPGRYFYDLKLQFGQQLFVYVVPLDIQDRIRIHMSSDSVIFTRSGLEKSGRDARLLDFPSSDKSIDYVIEKQPSWCECAIVDGPNGRKALRINVLSPPSQGVVSEKVIVAEKLNPANRAIVSVCFVNSA